MQEAIYLNLSKFYEVLSKKNFNKYLQEIIGTSHSKHEYLRTKNYKLGLLFYNKILRPGYSEGLKSIAFQEKIILPEYAHTYYKKLWKNENLKNKTLFVFNYWCGFGDFIQYARYIPLLKTRTKHLILEVDENLLDLYKFNFPYCEIIKNEFKEFKGYDYTYHHELFLNFQKDLNTFPHPEGYLKVNPDLIFKYSKIINSNKKKVGIFWKSISKGDRLRSMSNKDIIPIIANNNIQFYSLTKETPDEETKTLLDKYNVISCAPYIQNAHDTAAIMKNLDLVISTDSFPIHLAGALGVKAYLMLPCDCDWRWFNDTKTTPWYDSVTIFKQVKQNDWQNVVYDISLELL